MENSMPRKNNIFFFEDFSAKELNENKVGRKGLSLFNLKEMDVPVPEFFVVGSHVFTEFCTVALENRKLKLLDKGRNPENEEVLKALLDEDFSKEVQEDILSAYTRLSGFKYLKSAKKCPKAKEKISLSRSPKEPRL